MIRGFLLLPIVAALALPAAAAGKGDWSEVNRAIADEHAIPRYRALSGATDSLATVTAALCESPDAVHLKRVRDGYHHVMDEWQGIQHMTFGPAELFMRRYRIQMWPDKHGTGARQTRALLKAQDAAKLSASAIARGSAALQGLPILERLLFSDDTNPAAFGNGDEPSYRCRLTEAVARNLSNMAGEIRDEWTSGTPSFRGRILGDDRGDGEPWTSEEIASLFLKDLSTALQVVADLKLRRPLGDTAEKARPRRAESWRSRRSLRNVRVNLAAARDLYETGFAPVLTVVPEGNVLDRRIRDGFAAALSAAETDLVFYESAADPEERRVLEALLGAVVSLDRVLSSELPPALGLSLGFNALDGD